MANLLERFVHRTEFDSYEDFCKNFAITVPENFNFAYDVVDVYATEQPEKRALIWVDDHNHERTLTFGDLKYLSDKAANFFLSQGIRKGDHVMLILRGHYSFWSCLLGLHKIGAITTPATHMLTSKDLVYRIDKGDIRMIVASNWAQLPEHVEDNIRTFTPIRPLSESDRKALQEALALYRKHLAVPCTACKYCLPCPVGVEIPKIFGLYNQYKISGNKWLFSNNYNAIPEDSRADACVNCGKCLKQCPQKIRIPEELKKIAKEFA